MIITLQSHKTPYVINAYLVQVQDRIFHKFILKKEILP